MAYRITLIPGDGIGPEVAGATVKVLEASGLEFDWDRCEQIGTAAVEADGTPLPDGVLASIRANKVALKGPVATPVGKGFKSVNVQLRQKLDLYANVRPCSSLPGIETPFRDVNLVIFRENTEGLYSGMETYDERLEIADATARVTRAGTERIIRSCFEYAKINGHHRVTLAHKANILKVTSGMFLRIGEEISSEYPDIEFSDRIIDNMCMQLVMRPQDYECIVTTNLFGDILSDLCAGLVGGLGIVGGANLGDEVAVFEAVHGSAPDIAGQNIANPTALMRSGEMMLRHLGERSAADAVRSALFETFEAGEHLTRDLGGRASTVEFADRVAEKVARIATSAR
jgi:isocitrate dehydrogenase (NAD+)